ncbi:hypothetical protein CB1_001683045, partial [Camelus ferus]
EDVSYEERDCEGGKFATVEVTDKPVDEALREAMPKVMKYVGGTNDKGIGMGMTVPISFAVFPDKDGSLQKKLKVWFRIPNAFQSSPPVPSDNSIKIEERDSITVYSMSPPSYPSRSDAILTSSSTSVWPESSSPPVCAFLSIRTAAVFITSYLNPLKHRTDPTTYPCCSALVVGLGLRLPWAHVELGTKPDRVLKWSLLLGSSVRAGIFVMVIITSIKKRCSTHLVSSFLISGIRGMQFGGYAKEADYVARAAQLRTALEGTASYKSDIYFCTGYDPPMKPYGRRNEIWLVKT